MTSNEVTLPMGRTKAEIVSCGSSFDDVVILAALRTPICKARRGSFKVLARPR